MLHEPTPEVTTTAPGQAVRARLSRLSLGLCCALLAGTFLLMSPPAEATFPGQIPWSDNSLLHGIVNAMSLGGLIHTVRGVEIKDLVLYLAAPLLLLVFAVRVWAWMGWPAERRSTMGAWGWAQVALGGWVLLSALSALWSGDPAISVGQATIYAFCVALAVGIAWTLESPHVPLLLGSYTGIAAVAALLCAWYYHERNPAHRPGFPIGNPSPLAAAILPALLIAVAWLLAQARNWSETRRISRPGVTLASAVALVPLTYCLILTDSRGVFLGGLVGILGVGLILAQRQLRWFAAIVMVLIGAGAGAYFANRAADLTMARGETIRFRAYAWRYAADLWGQRTISGHGAGAYPRLASVLSLNDRVLDPAAFMGDLVEHAHNELFEVLAEIGLVGGVTYVSGFVATLMAAAGILSSNLSRDRRYLLIGLTAGFIALMADACVGVGLRLPGLPAVYFTLLGVLWAVGRAVSKTGERAATPASRRRWLGIGGIAGSAGLALVLFFAAGNNWLGVRAEYRAARALDTGDFYTAIDASKTAVQCLLDPVRTIVAQQQGVIAAVEYAGQETEAWLRKRAGASSTSAAATTAMPAGADPAGVIADCQQAFQACLRLNQRAPMFGRMGALAARCCEWLAELVQSSDAQQAGQWRREAFGAWTFQRLERPYDSETLIALATRYPATVEQRIGWLRDALRAGFPNKAWYDALHATMSQPGASAALPNLLAAAGPFDPQTQIDSLVLSMAPETLRLVSAWQLELERSGQAGGESQSGDACELLERAVRLYAPLRTRFPELRSVALAEEADCCYRRNAAAAMQSITLLKEALAALPVIQEQKYQLMAKPYRIRLAQYQLATGDETAARQTLALVPIEAGQVEGALAALRVNLERTHPPASAP